ncbi:DNA cytosine methyltransferase [uncultured Sporomusa sp.]|nr:DNA cytosine methyltransferase [uncultured Sporomusa sp.]
MIYNKYKLIDLFCGAGGLSLGFSNLFGHNFEPVWANDFNQYAADTYNENFGKHCIVGDIVDLLNDPEVKIPAADIVIGGPPCQGFSLLNKNRDGDVRRHLWRPFMEVVERSGAEIFVMENVPQLLNSEEYEDIAQHAVKLGFFPLVKAKLCAADYGVPQVRFRAFIIGCRFTDPGEFFPPLKTHFNPSLGSNLSLSLQAEYVHNPLPWQTVRNAIGDLPKPVGTEIRKNVTPPLDLHFGRTPTETSLKRYMSIPHEGMNRFDLQRVAPEITPKCWIKKTSGGTDLFGRLWWDRPSVTIRTEFFKPEKGRYLHPCEHRPITHREAARIQSFPDSFRFLGSKIEIAKQIGNAVPPLLAAQIAGCVEKLLKARSKEKSA